MIVYDCEIEKAIPQRNEPRIQGIKYCHGWRDFEGMGISVIVAYDFLSHEYRVFCQDNLYDFQELVRRSEIIVGFNNNSFDDQLCKANGIYIPPEKSYDLLSEIWTGVGLPRSYKSIKQAGFGLDACSKANGGHTKSGHGALAPIQWQQGKNGAVIDYCLHDVWLTVILLKKVIRKGEINHPKTPGETIKVKGPPTGQHSDYIKYYESHQESDADTQQLVVAQPEVIRPTSTPRHAEHRKGYVVVCDKCLRAGCAQGKKHCREHGTGTLSKSIAELSMLGMEHPNYWKEAVQ